MRLFGNAITVCSAPVADRDDKSVHPYEPFRNILSVNLISECSILFEFTHKLEAQLMELHSNAQRFDFLTLAPILQTLMLLKMRTFKTSFLFNSKMRTIYLSVTRLNFFGLWTVGWKQKSNLRFMFCSPSFWRLNCWLSRVNVMLINSLFGLQWLVYIYSHFLYVYTNQAQRYDHWQVKHITLLSLRHGIC